MKKTKKTIKASDKCYMSIRITEALKRTYEDAALKDRRSTSSLMALTLEQHQPK